MDAIDNPSYFSLPPDASKRFRNLLSLRKWSEHSKNHGATLPSNSSSHVLTKTNPGCAFRKLNRTTSEDTDWLVLGKPRPEDVAPSLYGGRYHQRHSSTGNVNSNDLMHQDMVHCRGGDNDVLFNTGRNAQYYNTATVPVSQVPTTRRRHSIGSFLNRDKVLNSGSENESKSRESSIRRKFKKNIKGGGKMVEDELDILLVSCGESEAATLWVNYLISCFQQISRERNKPPFKLQNIKLEDTLSPLVITSNLIERYPDARLQIVVICPFFLQKIQSVSMNENLLRRILNTEKILAMMLGVQDHTESSRLKNVFPECDQWRKMNVKDQDPTFVGDFLGVSMDILSRTWQLQEITNVEHEATGFSIIPKKVKVGQNKLIILLLEPLTAEDGVKVIVYKNGQRIDVPNAKRRNPYTIQFTMPACCLQVSMLVSVQIEKNGKSIGQRMVKCESKMRELEQLLKSLDNPIQFLCQSFSLNTDDKDQLDTFLLQNFQKNTPNNFHLFSPALPLGKGYSCNEEYPTLLHFSARYGLERLSWQLMESPGGEQACQIRNCSHLTAADMAEKANHIKLANVLKGYMQMTELSSVYNYLKGISEREEKFADYNYLLPRPLCDTYLIPPAARPVDPLALPSPITDVPPSPSLPYYANFRPCNFSALNAVSPTSSTASSTFLPSVLDNYDVPLNGRPYTPRTPSTPRSPVENKLDAYLDMNPGNDSSRLGSLSGYPTTSNVPEHFGSFNKLDTYERASVTSESYASSKYGSANQLSTTEKLSPDDELLEIINDFKNHVFTITEVEALVENWQNRNDVQQSFRDKQEQLTKMREEYYRIQRRMKDHMKRTTPFERIRKFFSRGKSKHSESTEKANVNAEITTPQFRPASSLSLYSSSSGSSGANSISSGSYIPVDANTNKTSSLKSEFVEKLNKSKTKDYAEIPQPPKYLDLNVNADFSEYVQPDCSTAPIKVNHRQSCNGSVLNETIQECNEVEIAESSVYSPICNTVRMKSPHCTHSYEEESKNKYYKTNSLRLDSKRKNKHNIRNKVKSAENLVDNKEFSNGPIAPISLHFETKDNCSPTSILKSRNELSACANLCAQTLKCLSDMGTSQDEDPIREITFEFDKITNVSTSDCESVANSHKSSSSLDLSSLSLNSNCTIDENCEIEHADKEKCSLEFNITEEGDLKTETAPPLMLTSEEQDYVNICNSPEYVKVNIGSGPINEGCKYTIVSS